MKPRNSDQIYLGTMSGTSMDGLDVVAINFTGDTPHLLYSQNTAYPEGLKEALSSMALDSQATVTHMCQLDALLGQFYAAEINSFLFKHKINRKKVTAIGSHGQTLRHSMTGPARYSLQIGDPNIIAAETDITVVADFRRKDIALGGQGAPLTPAFHHQVFHSTQNDRVIINIGGIANITHLPATTSIPTTGFDTGPGNTLLDHYCHKLYNKSYDSNGGIARNGIIDQNTLQLILNKEPYFSLSHPKSTGTDYFSASWLDRLLPQQLTPQDLIATLTELTAVSISSSVLSLPSLPLEAFVCGGGAHNSFLIERIDHHLKNITVRTTEHLGINPDWVEAIAFAWLARQTINFLPGNLPDVTHSRKETILGGVYFSNGQME